DETVNAATFFVSLQDFTEVGDTSVFIDEPQVTYIEGQMMERGYLDSRSMGTMFNMLRANDLIWSNVVNNYFLGKEPPAFDLLYWTNDKPVKNAEQWLESAEQHEGSWWADWLEWLGPRSGEQVAPPAMGSATHAPITPAPGTYVLEK